MTDFAIPGLMDVPPVVVAQDNTPYLCHAEVGVYRPSPVFHNDTWKGIPLLTLTVNGVAPAATLASAVMVFNRPNRDPGLTPSTGYELTTEKGDIEILDATLWKLRVKKVVLPLDYGRWEFKIKTTDSDGVVKTRVVGEILILR